MPFDDGQPIEATFLGNGSVAAPTAGTSFCGTTNIPDAGVYLIEGEFEITGAAEPQAQNVALVVNNSTVITYPSSGGVTAVVPFRVARIALNGSIQPFLKAVANATASTVYSGWISASRIG
jgi:hypothetical protein